MVSPGLPVPGTPENGGQRIAITGERTKGKNVDERKHEANKAGGESGRCKLVRFIAWLGSRLAASLFGACTLSFHAQLDLAVAVFQD